MPVDARRRFLARPVVLVGLSGTGKSTVAPLLAHALGVRAVDLDRRIEAEAGRSVAEIFAAGGEAAFRALELDTLGVVLGEPPSVVAAGGGVVCGQEARELLRLGSVVVWLDADDDELLQRLEGPAEQRPLLRDDPATTLRRLRREREAWYEELSVARIAVDGLEPQQVADGILVELSRTGATA
jgi:shikimate kinase